VNDLATLDEKKKEKKQGNCLVQDREKKRGKGGAIKLTKIFFPLYADAGEGERKREDVSGQRRGKGWEKSGDASPPRGTCLLRKKKRRARAFEKKKKKRTMISGGARNKKKRGAAQHVRGGGEGGGAGQKISIEKKPRCPCEKGKREKKKRRTPCYDRGGKGGGRQTPCLACRSSAGEFSGGGGEGKVVPDRGWRGGRKRKKRGVFVSLNKVVKPFMSVLGGEGKKKAGPLLTTRERRKGEKKKKGSMGRCKRR